MNSKKPTKTTKNSLPFISLKFGAVAVAAGLLFSLFTNNHRQYSAGNIPAKDEKEKYSDAQGMIEYFFNARKNITTNAIDYKSMFAASIADRAMANARRSHASTTVPSFSWDSYGPTATGGRTRAILIDNLDPTHQTIFAGGVTGGIWKSTDGGSHWGNSVAAISFPQNDTAANINVECIAQAPDGSLYIGGGEGVTENGGVEFSSGEVGGGIYKSTDDGATWHLLPSTYPSPNSQNAWAFTNRIAIQPKNGNIIYAANNYGLYISRDGGNSWRGAWNCATIKKLYGSAGFNALDVKISGDGSIVVADIGGYGYVCTPLSGPDSCFTQIHPTGAGRLPGGASRIEFAISPTNPNRIYASDIQGYVFGIAKTGSGIFMTTNASTNGGYWYNIGPGGSMAFDPYISASDQCVYDNTLAVFPNNEDYLLLGGTTIWKWFGNNTGDTIGQWSKVSHYGGGPWDPLWVHADDHAIVFDQSNPNIVFIGCDGGIFKSTDATNEENISGTMSFGAYNRNYTVTQYYHICYSPQVFDTIVPYGNSTKMEGLGLGGGTQDNGSPYMTGYGFYPNDAGDLTGGDGGGCAVSQLNPNIAYACIDYGTFLGRIGSLKTTSGITDAYTAFQGRCGGADIQAVAGNNNGSFVFPVALYENSYDLLNHDTILYVADKNYKSGDTIYAQSANGPLYYPYKLPFAVRKDSVINIPDRVVSRLAVAFNGKDGVWINGQGATNYSVVWKPIGGPLSKPNAYNGTASVHALAWSPDGDALFTGDGAGAIFRFSNINALNCNRFCSGSLYWDSNKVSHVTGDTTVHSHQLSSPVGGRDILSMAVDPKNGNNLMVTAGNYGSGAFVYYSTNAQTGPGTFVSVQGNLPLMPVYSCIVDLRNSDGTFLTGSAMVGTEHGIYTTDKLNGNATVWVKNSDGFPNVLTFDMKQQTLPNYQCNNAGDIYVGTHGRGAWVSTTLNQAPTAVPVVNAPAKLDNLKVYPNPMTTQGNIEFSLTSTENVVISIYDIQGKEVKTITLNAQDPGKHVVPFATSDFRAGTYFATVTGSSFRKSCKFVVVK